MFHPLQCNAASNGGTVFYLQMTGGAKYATNASGTIWWPNLVQVMESISGSDVPLAMFICGKSIYDISAYF